MEHRPGPGAAAGARSDSGSSLRRLCVESANPGLVTGILQGQKPRNWLFRVRPDFSRPYGFFRAAPSGPCERLEWIFHHDSGGRRTRITVTSLPHAALQVQEEQRASRAKTEQIPLFIPQMATECPLAVTVTSSESRDTTPQHVRAQAYWRGKPLFVIS